MRTPRQYAIFSFLLAACFFGASVASAQLGVVVKGRVLDLSGAPISLALVHLFSADRVLEMKSDIDGRFEFGGVPPGAYDLEVGAVGFARQVKEDIRVGDDDLTQMMFTLHPGEHSGRTVVTLNAAPSVRPSLSYEKGTDSYNLAGAVFDNSSGGPLANTKIILSRLAQKHTLTSGDKGEFQFSDLEPGRYTLTVEREGYWAADLPYDLWIARQNLTRLVIVLFPETSSR